jgi:hypothetical protein
MAQCDRPERERSEELYGHRRGVVQSRGNETGILSQSRLPGSVGFVVPNSRACRLDRMKLAFNTRACRVFATLQRAADLQADEEPPGGTTAARAPEAGLSPAPNYVP